MYRNGGSFFSVIPPVTKNLIIINFIIWLAMMLFPAKIGDVVMHYCGLHYFEASDFNLAQVFTYMFVHSTDGIAHLFFNMFTLFMFGITLERVLGGKRYLFFYLSCGIGAAIMQEIVWYFCWESIFVKPIANLNGISLSAAKEAIQEAVVMGYDLPFLNSLVTVGASGAIYGVLLAFGMIFPNRPLYLMFIPVPIKAKWMVIGYGLIELALGLASARDGVAHFAHLGGMIFGFLILWYWKRNGTINRNGYY